MPLKIVFDRKYFKQSHALTDGDQSFPAMSLHPTATFGSLRHGTNSSARNSQFATSLWMHLTDEAAEIVGFRSLSSCTKTETASTSPNSWDGRPFEKYISMPNRPAFSRLLGTQHELRNNPFGGFAGAGSPSAEYE